MMVNAQAQNLQSWIENERLMKLSGRAAIVLATGLGYANLLANQDLQAPMTSTWDDLGSSSHPLIGRNQLIDATNANNRLLSGLSFWEGTSPLETCNYEVAEAKSYTGAKYRGANQSDELLAGHLLRVFDVPAQVDFVSQRLSLSVTELAAILDVKRPTIYAWRRGEASPQEKNVKRLALLVQIAKHWVELSDEPLYRRLRHAFDTDGRTLFGMLKSERLDMREIKKHLQKLASLPTSRPVSMRELAGSNALSNDDRADTELAWESGTSKQFGSDLKDMDRDE